MVADGRQCVKENDHEDECVFVAHKQGRGPGEAGQHCTRCPWSDPYAEVGMRLPCEGVAIPSASKQGDEPVAWMCKHSRAPYEYCGSVSSGRVAPQGRHVPFDRWPTCPGDWQPLYPAPLGREKW